MNRDAFVGRVRDQLGRAAGAPVPPPPHPAPAPREPLAATDLAARFAQRQLGLHSDVHSVASRAEALHGVARLAAERGWRTVCGPPQLRTAELAAQWSDDPRRADAGLAVADYAIADTGTVVLLNAGPAARSHSLVPPVSVLLVPASRLVPHLGDVLRLLGAAPDELPACVSFVSGPSNTADISGVLCLGAHGPTEVVVWLMAAE